MTTNIDDLNPSKKFKIFEIQKGKRSQSINECSSFSNALNCLNTYNLNIWALIDSQRRLFYFLNHNSCSYAFHVFDILFEVILRGKNLR